jgi:antitoxin PrlF
MPRDTVNLFLPSLFVRTIIRTMAKATRYTGAVTTSGNSEAIRLEKALFRAHPEFKRGHAVTATIIAPGQMLVSVTEQRGVEGDVDPIVDAFLAFLASDIERHPERIAPLPAGTLARATALTEGITTDDDELFPDDLTI